MLISEPILVRKQKVKIVLHVNDIHLPPSKSHLPEVVYSVFSGFFCQVSSQGTQGLVSGFRETQQSGPSPIVQV